MNGQHCSRIIKTYLKNKYLYYIKKTIKKIGGNIINEINFTFFENYAKVIEELEDENDKKDFLLAIYLYIYKDEIPDFKGMKKIAWLGLVSSLETSKNRALGKKNKTKTNQKQIKNKKKTNQKQTPSTSTSYSNSYSNSLDNLENKDKDIKKEKEIFTEDVLTTIQTEFNNIGLSKVIKLSKSRKEKMRLRLKEYGEELILDAIKKIPESKFLMGNNKQGWKCSFDWLFDNDKNILKVYEGNYDGKEKTVEDKVNNAKEMNKYR